jgi:hypothetical protein
MHILHVSSLCPAYAIGMFLVEQTGQKVVAAGACLAHAVFSYQVLLNTPVLPDAPDQCAGI